MGKEDEVRIIAYRIWEEDGCRHGHAVEHWLKAEIIWENQQPDEKKEKTEPAAEPKNAETKSVQVNKPVKKTSQPLKKFNTY